MPPAINAREAAAKEAAEKTAEIEKSMTTGWDTSESSSQKNFEKAVSLIKGNSDYILNKEAISPDPGEALRKNGIFRKNLDKFYRHTLV